MANARLYVRSLSEVEARPISGTEGGGNIFSPVFSPDSRSIAFVSTADGTIKRIALSGGVAVTVCAFDTNPNGMSWGPDGILFEQGGNILRVSSKGGKPELLVAAKAVEVIHGPQMLPDGQTVLFTIASGTGADASAKARVVTYSLKSGERKTLIDGGVEGRYIPTGHIAYALRGVLFAVAFDARRQEVTGGAVPLVEGVKNDGVGQTAHYSFSTTGSLVYVPGGVVGASGTQRLLAFIDRKGNAEPLRLPAGQYDVVRVSPDGKRVALGVDDGKEQMVGIYELAGTSAMRRLTFDGKNRFPLWSADGHRVAFQSDRQGDVAIFWQPADGGTAERLTKPEQGTVHVPESWSPDGKEFLFSATKGSTVSLWTFSLEDRKAAPFDTVQSSLPINATFSPDGRWVAYQSTETGTMQVFVRPVPPGARYQISKTTSASIYPLWSPDGKNLFFIPGPSRFAVVSITTRPGFAVTDAVAVPRGGFVAGGPTTVRTYDVAHDGRIVGLVPVEQMSSGALRGERINVVLTGSRK